MHRTKRPRAAVACARCKSRKQRCDNDYPSCGNCTAAGQECDYADGSHPAGYVRSLEGQVHSAQDYRSLKRRRSRDLPGRNATAAQKAAPEVSAHRHDDHHDTPFERDGRSSTALEYQEKDDDANNESPTDSYLGTSSGLPLATIMQAGIDVTHQPKIESTASNPWLPAALCWQGLASPLASDDRGRTQPITGAEMPDADITSRLIAAFLNKVHTKHPFLSTSRIQKLAEQRYTILPVAQLGPNTSLERKLDYCILQLIFAIGARYLQLSEEYKHRPSEDYYYSALVDVRLASTRRCLESLEVMTLLTIYELRSASEPGIWSIIGATTRQAVGFGLHRASNHSPLLDQRRKRIFWTIYMLERSIALTLGRPFSISERDIDVDLPANVDHDIDDEEDMRRAIETAAQGPDEVYAISPALHIFRLHRIISNIQSTVHRVDRPISSVNKTEVARLRRALDDWYNATERNIPSTPEREALSPYVTKSYHTLQYHKATLFLLLPTLTTVSSADADFYACLAAAGQIGHIYKRLHDTQKTRISLSYLAVHANLLAGLTLVYCYAVDPRIFSPKFSGDIRACSTVLYIISERWPAARKAKDCLEHFVQATIEKKTPTAEINSPMPYPYHRSDWQSAPVYHFEQHSRETNAETSQSTAEGPVQPDSVWNMLESVLGDNQYNWLEGFDGQNFLDFA